ncbi:MAG: putative inorganic carbon transporter subunit DabA, partial [Flavobacterium sp.]
MNSQKLFDEENTLHLLSHYLPAQNPLKDFVHHNTLHAFQKYNFFEAMQKASIIFDYKTYLSLSEFRKLYHDKKIDETIIQNILKKYQKNDSEEWFYNLTKKRYALENQPRIGSLRKQWKEFYQINLEKSVQTLLFRLVSNYLDQGIGIWNFPKQDTSFLEAIKWLEKNSFSSIFKTERSKKLLNLNDLSIEMLLKILVGDPIYYEGYLFDQQFTHPGWSGMVSIIEQNSSTLLDTRKISLRDFIILELLLEIDTLDAKFGEIWIPLGLKTSLAPNYLFDSIEYSELFEVLSLWQKSYEWTYYDQVLSVIDFSSHQVKSSKDTSFIAIFCIDDRECSIRRNLEHQTPKVKTYGTAGFFNVEFFYKPLNGKFYTKLCPAPVTPKYLIKEIGEAKKQTQDLHYHQSTHSLLMGWLIAQTLGFYAAIQLFMNIFRPKISASTSSSFSHTNINAS